MPPQHWETLVESPTSLGTNCSCLPPILRDLGVLIFPSQQTSLKALTQSLLTELCPSLVTQRIGNPQVGAFLDNKNYVFVCAKSSPSASGFNMIVELLI